VAHQFLDAIKLEWRHHRLVLAFEQLTAADDLPRIEATF
jgi:hypothetical protein